MTEVVGLFDRELITALVYVAFFITLGGYLVISLSSILRAFKPVISEVLSREQWVQNGGYTTTERAEAVLEGLQTGFYRFQWDARQNIVTGVLLFAGVAVGTVILGYSLHPISRSVSSYLLLMVGNGAPTTDSFIALEIAVLAVIALNTALLVLSVLGEKATGHAISRFYR